MSRDQRSEQAKTYRRLYSTARWRRTRDNQLRDHPLCHRCQARGFIVAASVCNHSDPKTKLNPATFYDGPFDSVCAPCHDQVVQSEERTGKPQPKRVGFSGAVDENGWPRDGRHPANRGSL